MQGYRFKSSTIASMVSPIVKGQRFGQTRIGNQRSVCANTTAPQAAVPGIRRQPSKRLRQIRMFDTAATSFTASLLLCAMRLQIMRHLATTEDSRIHKSPGVMGKPKASDPCAHSRRWVILPASSRQKRWAKPCFQKMTISIGGVLRF